jgi:hypothetical protein
MPPKLAALIAVAAVICILLSTILGVSQVSDWLLYAAEGLFGVAIVIFGAYVIFGIIRDARAIS